MIRQELSEATIGSAMLVLNSLKPGLDEKIDERDLAMELRKRGQWAQTQVELPAFDVGKQWKRAIR